MTSFLAPGKLGGYKPPPHTHRGAGLGLFLSFLGKLREEGMPPFLESLQLKLLPVGKLSIL